MQVVASGDVKFMEAPRDGGPGACGHTSAIPEWCSAFLVFPARGAFAANRIRPLRVWRCRARRRQRLPLALVVLDPVVDLALARLHGRIRDCERRRQKQHQQSGPAHSVSPDMQALYTMSPNACSLSLDGSAPAAESHA